MLSFRIRETYSFGEVASAFGMKPAVLTWQGGIISRPSQEALLLVTRPDLESIEYHDHWIDEQLVYCARGKKGDQKLTGANRLLAENARRNYVFESLGGARMLFLGTAHAVQHWWDEAPGTDGHMRMVIRYLLHFGEGVPEDVVPDLLAPDVAGAEGTRRLRQHLSIERSRAIVDAAKRHWIAADPMLRCEVCALSFAAAYGNRGSKFIEAHHRVPLETLGPGTKTRVADLAPVCANCHRMLHVSGGCSLEELRAHVDLARSKEDTRRGGP